MISNEHGMCGVNLLDSVAPPPTHLLNFGRRVQHKKSEGERRMMMMKEGGKWRKGSAGRRETWRINKYLKTGRKEEGGRIFIAPSCSQTTCCLGWKRDNDRGQVWLKTSLTYWKLIPTPGQENVCALTPALQRYPRGVKRQRRRRKTEGGRSDLVRWHV